MRRRWIFLIALGGLVLAVPVGWAGYASAAWLMYGHAERRASPDSLIERFMPRYDISEVHQTRVAAPASVTWDIVRAMDLQRSGIIHAIFRSRELLLGASPNARPQDFPLVRELVSLGWGVLEEVPGRAMVFGSVTQPWRPNVTFRSLPPASYVAFDSADYVKIVVTLAVDSLGPRESLFRTETRVQTTDAEARSKFRRYWSIFSPGILLIRHESLKLVRRESEAASEQARRLSAF